MNAHTPMSQQPAEAAEIYLTKIVTERVTEPVDLGALLRDARNGTSDQVVRVSVHTQTGDGAFAGSAIQEFDTFGRDLSSRTADFKVENGKAKITLRLESETVADLTMSMAPDRVHLASQIAALWQQGVIIDTRS